MRRRRDRIGDRGSVIILKGWPEDDFFRMLVHSDECALSLRSLWTWIPDRARLEPMAKSLGLYDVWSGSATMPISEATPLLPSTLMLLFCGTIMCCFK